MTRPERRRVPARLARAVALILTLALGAQLAACDQAQILADDLGDARAAVAERNWPLAERLLERYLR